MNERAGIHFPVKAGIHTHNLEALYVYFFPVKGSTYIKLFLKIEKRNELIDYYAEDLFLVSNTRIKSY